MAAQHEALNALETAANTVGNKVTVVGAVTGGVGWFAQVNWIGLLGVLIALVGAYINWYYKRLELQMRREEAARKEARMQAEHLARMRNLERESKPDPLGELGAEG